MCGGFVTVLNGSGAKFGTLVPNLAQHQADFPMTRFSHAAFSKMVPRIQEWYHEIFSFSTLRC